MKSQTLEILLNEMIDRISNQFDQHNKIKHFSDKKLYIYIYPDPI